DRRPGRRRRRRGVRRRGAPTAVNRAAGGDGTPPTTSAGGSLWRVPDAPAYRPPGSERAFDVVVLGAGIVGLTTALLLKRSGARVAVVEAARVGRGVTGHSTAKVSALQSTMLGRMARTRGDAVAHEYARLNAAAVEFVAATVAEAGIDCDLQRRTAYTAASTESALSDVHREVDLAPAAGLPAELTKIGRASRRESARIQGGTRPAPAA